MRNRTVLGFIRKNWVSIIIFATIFFLFREWFTTLPLSTGDWLYNFPQAINQSTLYPYSWINHTNFGLGGNGIFVLPLNTFYYFGNALLFNIGIPWEITEKIIWFIPFILISSVSSFLFFKKFIANSSSFASVASLIFTANTYVFMVAGGGQLAVGISYALIPAVFYGFLNVLHNIMENKKPFNASLIAGIIFSIQLFYDLRIAYVTLLFVGIYYLLIFLTSGFKFLLKSFIPFFIVPGIVTFFLNFFWIVPFVLVGKNPLSELGAQYSAAGIVEFLSFAKFENTISLLHPNWPEDLFGKVYFMRPEFLLIPIIAFSSLLFVKTEKIGKSIAIFSLIAIIAAFLAKGTNDPFGAFYTWAFNVVPGIQMFRDPTKWYGVTIFAFSILIPFSLLSISKLKPNLKQLPNIIIFTFVIFWLVTIRFSVVGELPGTFSPQGSPTQYSRLTEYLSSQNSYFRTLWVPNVHQYTYSPDKNLAIPAADFLGKYSPKSLASKISKNLDKLSDASIKYVIIPDDVYGKIFTDDRKYNERVYQGYINATESINGIKEVAKFDKIVVFELPNPKDLFWSTNRDLKIVYKTISPVNYELNIENARAGDAIIFSQNFDTLWSATSNGQKLKHKKYMLFDNRSINSFVLPKDGNYKIRIEYTAQKWVDIGLFVSGISFIVVILIILFSKKKK